MNHRVLPYLRPEQVEVEIWRADELKVRRGLSSELDEMWSFVRSKANPRWLWHAIDHHSGTVLAYVFGRRKDTIFRELQALLEPFGITRFYTRWMGGVLAAYRPRAASCWKGEYAKNRRSYWIPGSYAPSIVQEAQLLFKAIEKEGVQGGKGDNNGVV